MPIFRENMISTDEQVFHAMKHTRGLVILEVSCGSVQTADRFF